MSRNRADANFPIFRMMIRSHPSHLPKIGAEESPKSCHFHVRQRIIPTWRMTGRPERRIGNRPGMATKSKKGRTPNKRVESEADDRTGERYLDLVRENPLRIIRSQEQYAHSLAMLDRLSARGIDRTRDETEYLLALAVFIEKFEQQQRPNP
jgi:hypothetical protein